MGASKNIPIAEWIVAALGVFALAAALVILLRGEAKRGDRPPAIELRIVETRAGHGAWTVVFEARNTGDKTAAALGIAGELHHDGRVVESSHATIDYLPSSSTRTGGLFFRQDPSQGTVILRPLGYQAP